MDLHSQPERKPRPQPVAPQPMTPSRCVILVQSAGDLPLALFNLFSYLGTHSKASVRWVNVILFTHHLTPQIAEGFRAFLSRDSNKLRRVRLAKA